MKKLAIFDLDGTLLNTIKDLGDAVNYALDHNGFHTHSVASYPYFVGNGVKRLIERALPEDARKNAQVVSNMLRDFKTYYNDHNTDRTVPYEGMPELLRTLQDNGVMLAVASNKYQQATEKIINHYFADINWTQVTNAVKKAEVHFTEIPKYPAVSRDLALLIDKNVEFAQIEQIARQTEKKLLKQVELFDVYEGKNLPEGKKSYAVNFVLQDSEKTMNDKAIDAIMNKLINNLKKQLNCELR